MQIYKQTTRWQELPSILCIMITWKDLVHYKAMLLTTWQGTYIEKILQY